VAHNQSRDVAIFDRDASSHGGYLYTINDRLSSRMALGRMLDAIMTVGRVSGRSVLDIGCGDGFFTFRYMERGGARRIVGIDPARGAVKVANMRGQIPGIEFVVGTGHCLPFRDKSFDLALMQGVLHHDTDPKKIIEEAMRLASGVLILEPNGNNPGLKVIEKTSRYHIDHGEKSYASWQLRRWVEECGGTVERIYFAGLVPIFCPGWMARLLKAIEPLVEKIPVLNAIGCAYCVLLVRPADA
jgi:ubiquinone/menaquinone biosynthesis C-methylase UbiE